jgi:hypothetical protein
METKNKIKENEWLSLLEMAVNEGVEIRVNHRFKYRNKNLGTFLTSAKRKNNIELTKQIKKLGINFKMHSTNPEDYISKFIKQLSKERKPNKQRYITRFNTYVLPKKEILKEQTIEKLNNVWKRKFGDIRKWEKPETVIDKIQKWKGFRYDEKTNPSGKWFDYKKNMGKLYGWVYTRKRNPDKMTLILEHFSEKEITELKKEGF